MCFKANLGEILGVLCGKLGRNIGRALRQTWDKYWMCFEANLGEILGVL